MRDVLLLGVRVVTGGTLVAGFSMLADMLKPKMFAGIFGAAPSVATAGLLVTGLSMGPANVETYATGMIAGAAGMAAYCVAAALAVKHLGAAAGSIVAWVAWVIPAAVVFVVVVR